MDPINTPEMSGSPMQQYTNFSGQKNNILLIVAAVVVISVLGFFFLYSSGTGSTKEVDVPTATPGPVKNREYMMMAPTDSNGAGGVVATPTPVISAEDTISPPPNQLTIIPSDQPTSEPTVPVQ